MYLREATLVNLPRLTKLYTISLTNDLFFKYKPPYRRQNSADVQYFSKLMLKRHSYDKKTTTMVTRMEKRDIAISRRGITYAGNVVGYAIWERMGRVEAKKRTLRGSVSRILAKLETRSISRQLKRHDIDFVRLAALEASLKVDQVQCCDILDWWYLSRLVVDSQFKDRGAKPLLVQWGTLKAGAESLWCGVEVCGLEGRLYKEYGFEGIKVNFV